MMCLGLCQVYLGTAPFLLSYTIVLLMFGAKLDKFYWSILYLYACSLVT